MNMANLSKKFFPRCAECMPSEYDKENKCWVFTPTKELEWVLDEDENCYSNVTKISISNNYHDECGTIEVTVTLTDFNNKYVRDIIYVFDGDDMNEDEASLLKSFYKYLKEYYCQFPSVMISIHMGGDEDVWRKQYYMYRANLIARGYRVKNTIFGIEEKEHKHIGVAYLAASLRAMSKVDKVFFAKGWENARGCRLEHEVAIQYGVEVEYAAE